MAGKLMLKKVIAGLKLSLFFAWCWPLSNNASKFTVSCMKAYRYLNITLGTGVVIPLLYAATKHLDNSIHLGKVILITCPILHNIWNLVFQEVYYRRIQYITYEMTYFSEYMKPHEEIVVQRYISRCIVFYSVFTLVFYITGLAFIVGPLVMNQPFPTLAEYPFDVYHQPLRSIIYVHQSVVGLQASSQLCANTFMALLLWFASVRFELLNEELRTIKDIYRVIKCIKKHHELLEYATEVAVTVRPFALSSIAASIIGVIISFLIFITKQPLLFIVQFFLTAVTSLVEVFMYVWPAEHLINVSQSIANAAFDTRWYNESTKIWKYLQMIIIRSQKPIIVTIPCVMPKLSFNYYASYLSSVLSYFTALRVILNKDTNE